MSNTLKNSALFALFLIIFSCAENNSTTPAPTYRIGMGLDYVAPWTTQIAFVDAFKQSKYWDGYQLGSSVSITDISDINLTLDSNGYPAVEIPFDHDNDDSTNKYVVNTVMFYGIGQDYPSGNYTLKFEGTGEISLNWDAGENPQNGYSATPRTYSSSGEVVSYTVPVEPNIGVHLQINESSASDPIRNIQFLMPGYENSESTNALHPFYPPFIEKLSGFEVIRVMNALFTNEVSCDNPADVPTSRSDYKNCTITWGNRVPQTYYTHTVNGRGMPWEYVIDLVNKVASADIWINIPHAADDDYVRNLAQLLLASLNTDRKIYIEWSNEVWNSGDGFPQHMWYQDNGLDIFPNDPLVVAGQKYYVRGLLNIFSIFRQVFSGQEERLVRVLNSQQGYTQRTIDLLSYLDDTSINPNLSGQIDALSVGSYFGWSLLERTDGEYVSPSMETLLSAARNDLSDILSSVQEAKAALDNYKSRNNITHHISLISYEAGSHITPMSTDWAYLGLGTNTDNIDWSSYTNANRSSQIYDIYRDLGKIWFENGGDLLVAFSFVCKYPQTYVDRAGTSRHIGTGIFCHLEHLNQSSSDAPKYRALRDMM